MTKLIFRKLYLDIFTFFIITSLSISLIVWVVQGVNLLDIVAEDGHSLQVYFTYVLLNFPKIFSKIIIFVFFISLFYMISKYQSTNEILVFWTNGIKKFYFINSLILFSLFFLLLQILLNLFIVPETQNLGRSYLKNSNIDFLPKLIREKKFVDLSGGLTIYIDEYKNNLLNDVYIKEKIDETKSKIITANYGKIVKKNQDYIFVLNEGGITNIDTNKDSEKTYTLNFKKTEYSLSKFSTKTVTVQKVQEMNSINLSKCWYLFNVKKRTDLNFLCKKGSEKQISQELFTRIIIPFYILVISLIASCLIINFKSTFFSIYKNIFLFSSGVLIIIFSQFSIRMVGDLLLKDIVIISMPIIFILIIYLLLNIQNQIKKI